MSLHVGDIALSVAQPAGGSPALLVEVPRGDEHDEPPRALLARRDVEDLRDACDRFLAGRPV